MSVYACAYNAPAKTVTAQSGPPRLLETTCFQQWWKALAALRSPRRLPAPRRPRRRGGVISAIIRGGVLVTLALAAAELNGRTNAPAPLIVCTTTHLSGLVATLGNDSFRTETIVPWGTCPGHFELKRSDIEKIRNASLILKHGHEQFLSAFEGKQAYAPVRAVAVPGNWMIPALQKKAAERTAAMLAEKFPHKAEMIRANLAAYQKKIDALENELQPHLQKISDTPAVCAAMSADYAAWMGIVVTAEFRRDADASVQNLQEVIRKARAAGARMVVDNLQSSGKTGRTLARQLDLPLVMLSNFPEPDSAGHGSYAATLKKNVFAVFNCNDSEP